MFGRQYKRFGIVDFIKNSGTFPCRIDSIYFSGADASAFQIALGMPPFEVEPANGQNVEFLFKPNRIGIHTAQINILTQSDTLIESITGEGIIQLLSVENKLIDFGKVSIGSNKDTIAVATIKNIGTVSLTIDSTKHNKPNDYDFSTLAGSAPFTLNPGETAKMNLRFKPSDVGRTSGVLDFYYNGVGSPAEVTLFGEGVQGQLASINNIIDFGKVTVGMHKDTLMAATISNIGTSPMQITNTHHTLPNDSDFTTIAGGGAFTLNPGDTAKLSLRFTPSGVGITNGGLAFDYNGNGSPLTIQLFGEGIIQNIPKFLLVSGSCESDVGSYVNIPIILINSKLAVQSGCTEIKTDLNLNSTLLFPAKGEPKGTITNDVRKLQLSYPVSASGTDTLGTIRMLAALGNVESTILMLENQNAIGGLLELDTLSGIFKLTNICHEGGTRLINPDGIASISQINPNPSSESIELKIILKEKGRTSLEIINLLGVKVATIFDSEMPVGENDLKFNTQNLSSGNYYLLLKTPSEIITQQLIIMK